MKAVGVDILDYGDYLGPRAVPSNANPSPDRPVWLAQVSRAMFSETIATRR
jgi:hypothetical protein